MERLFTESFFSKNDYFKNELKLSAARKDTILSLIKNWQVQCESFTKGVDKETSDSGEFIKVVFEGILGYSGKGTDATNYFHQSEFAIKGAGVTSGTGKADLALGNFDKNNQNPQVLVEFKDQNSVNLDLLSNRKDGLSPVDQCWNYLNTYEKAIWGIVTNYNEIRLYHKNSSKNKYEVFYFIVPDTIKEHQKPLSDEKELLKFITLLSKDHLLGNEGKSYTEKILELQGIEEKAVQTDFYLRYKKLRMDIFNKLVELNPDYNNTESEGKNKHCLLSLVQKFLDRIIFCWFCEDSREQLLPLNILDDMIKGSIEDSYYTKNGTDVYGKVRNLFKAIDVGGNFNILTGYNGGLFKEDRELDTLQFPNSIFEQIMEIGREYDFGEDNTLNVTILGHIFEQSITDIEEIKSEFDGEDFDKTKSKRKKDGVFYTPEYITGYIVENTIGEWLKEKYTYLERKYATAKKRELKILEEYKDNYLSKIKVVDPACGSGAFLIAAFDYLYKEHQSVITELNSLNKETIFDPAEADKSILENNLYGVDINNESVEITKLSLWLKTAKKDRKLSSLDEQIRCGNSLIDDETIAGDKAFKWEEKFNDIFTDRLCIEFHNGINEIDGFFYTDTILPKLDDEERSFIESNYIQNKKKTGFVPIEFGKETTDRIMEIFLKYFNDRGFDCVIGNPPYLRVQGLRESFEIESRFYERNYKSATGRFDIYVLFIEKGFSLINNSGLLSFILPHKFINSEFGIGIRKFIYDNKALQSLIHFGSEMVFVDASTYTCIIGLSKNNKSFQYCQIAPLSIMTSFNTSEKSYSFIEDSEKWQLQSNENHSIINKLENQPYKVIDLFKGILQGIVSGDNKAFYLYDCKKEGAFINGFNEITNTRVNIEKEVCKPVLNGKTINRYYIADKKEYLIFTYELVDEKTKLINEKKLESNFPMCYQFLNSIKERLSSRGSKNMVYPSWYSLWNYRNINVQNSIKILTPDVCYGSSMSLDTNAYFHNDTSYALILENADLILYKAYLAILNSNITWFYLQNTGTELRGGFFRFKTKYLEPFPLPDLSKDSISKLSFIADKMLSLNKKLHEKTERFRKEILKKYSLEKLNTKLNSFYELSFEEFIAEIKKVAKLKPASGKEERVLTDYWQEIFADDSKELLELKSEIERTDKEIDGMVYELYGLTEDEIRIVEGVE